MNAVPENAGAGEAFQQLVISVKVLGEKQAEMLERFEQTSMAVREEVRERFEQTSIAVEEVRERFEQTSIAVEEVRHTVSSFKTAALDVWQETQSITKSDRKKFRKELLQNYCSLSVESDEPNTVQCMVTGMELPSNEVTAAHIWPARARDDRAAQFGLKISSLDTYRNGILMAEALEKMFDQKRVSFSYNFINDNFEFQIIDPGLLNEKVKGLRDVYYRNLQGRVLQHPVGKMPYRRLLIWHYSLSLRHSVDKGWKSESDLPQIPPRRDVMSWLYEQSPDANDAKWPGPDIYARFMIDQARTASESE